MNYRLDMERGIDFIEEHLYEEITAQMIAEHVGYSLYHYCRIFLACYDMPVMEYVRKRRLSMAAQALLEGRKVIDVSLDHGFETASGFAKAFRREFGVSPTQYLARMKLTNLKDRREDGGILLMNPRIEKRESFKLVGYAISTNISEVSSTKDVAALWDQFDTVGWETKLYEQLNPPKHGEVGIFIPGEGDQVSYVLGVIVDTFEDATEDMICFEVPEATYAIFTTPPVNLQTHEPEFAKSIKGTWKAIFEEWFKDSGYEYDQSKLDFEYYDERCHNRIDSVMEIYIPIRLI